MWCISHAEGGKCGTHGPLSSPHHPLQGPPVPTGELHDGVGVVPGGTVVGVQGVLQQTLIV